MESYTVGLVWDAAPSLSFTLDYYHIEIDNRLALLSDTVDQAAVDTLIAAGIPNAGLLLRHERELLRQRVRF